MDSTLILTPILANLAEIVISALAIPVFALMRRYVRNDEARALAETAYRAFDGAMKRGAREVVMARGPALLGSAAEIDLAHPAVRDVVDYVLDTSVESAKAVLNGVDPSDPNALRKLKRRARAQLRAEIAELKGAGT